MKEYITNSYEETVALGERIAKALPKGSVVAFIGGYGKNCLYHRLCRGAWY